MEQIKILKEQIKYLKFQRLYALLFMYGDIGIFLMLNKIFLDQYKENNKDNIKGLVPPMIILNFILDFYCQKEFYKSNNKEPYMIYIKE